MKKKKRNWILCSVKFISDEILLEEKNYKDNLGIFKKFHSTETNKMKAFNFAKSKS